MKSDIVQLLYDLASQELTQTGQGEELIYTAAEYIEELEI